MKCPTCGNAIPLKLFTAYLGSLSRGKTSKAKKKASRINGKLGGRPKKQKGSKP